MTIMLSPTEAETYKQTGEGEHRSARTPTTSPTVYDTSDVRSAGTFPGLLLSATLSHPGVVDAERQQMAPTIRVDDEVYALLQSKAQAFVDTPNTVLRRLLNLAGSLADPVERPPRRAHVKPASSTKLARLLADGALDVDERLVWDRRNQGKQHEAWLTNDGRLRLRDGSLHDTPSSAARHVAGYEANGWKAWQRQRDGKSLSDIWEEHDQPATATTGAESNGPSSKAPPQRPVGRMRGLTPQKAFRGYILVILQEAGGRQEADKLLAELERRMEHTFLEGDYRILDGREVRWRNAARWERKDMVDDGLIKRSENRGVWELTSEGMNAPT
ncbi:winged helix-turn-helix domain-containing protein [Micromonospora sp. NPDC049799]|uniref:restriction system modified-DNA reader domain-containing protein n=1 Tax=Micromonospora sp. NPDC049799 TaxID=3154741 RepID=UPI00340FA46C